MTPDDDISEKDDQIERLQMELVMSIEDSIEDRLTELRELAVDDGIEINPESVKDLRKMLAKPLVFVLDNGNVRVRWNFKNVHLGIELMGDWTAEVVSIGVK